MLKFNNTLPINYNTKRQYIDIPLDNRFYNLKITKAEITIKGIFNCPAGTKIRIDYSPIINNQECSGWNNIESICQSDLRESILINFTDELEHAIKRKAQTIRLSLCNENLTVTNETITSYVEGITKEEFQQNSSYFTTNLDKSSDVKINLATSDFSLAHTDVTSDNKTLPLQIVHNYQSCRNNKTTALDNDLLPLHQGKGWSLNLQQYLAKTNREDRLQFNYFDADGKTHLIEECYYYLNQDNEKQFVNRKNLEVATDGSLEYNGHKVNTLLESPDRLKLIASIDDLPGKYLVDYEPEELINLREQIKQLSETKTKMEKTIATNELQLYILAINQYIITPTDTNGGLANDDPINIDDVKTNYDEFIENNYTAQELFNKFKNELNNIAAIKKSERDLYSIKLQAKNLANSNKEYLEQIEQYQQQLEKLAYQRDLYEMQTPVHYLYKDDQVVYGFGKIYIQNDDGTRSESNLYRLVTIADAYENAIYIEYEDLQSNHIKHVYDTNGKQIFFDYDEDTKLLKSIIDTRNSQTTFEYTNQLLTKISHANGDWTKYFYNDQGELTAAVDSTGLGTLLTTTTNDAGKNQQLDITPVTLLQKITDNKVTLLPEYQTLANVTLNDLVQHQITDQRTTINFYDYQSTTVFETKAKFATTYIFDAYGRATATYAYYQNQDINLNGPAQPAAVQEFNYEHQKVSDQVTILPYATDYLADIRFNRKATVTVNNLYLGTDGLYCSDQTFPYSYEVSTKYNDLPANDNADNTASVFVSSEQVAKINRDHPTTLVLSGWAQADSAYVHNADDEFIGDIAHYQTCLTSRRFHIAAKITYSDNTTYEYTKPFDWLNTGWQFGALPIYLDVNKTVQAIECIMDYSHNTGAVNFTDFKLQKGQWTHTEYNTDQQPVLVTDSISRWQTSYEYASAEPTRLTKKTIIDTANNQQYATTYEYNQSGNLIRATDHNGIVNENVYNDNGVCVKRLHYHRDNPTAVYYEESKLDDQGNATHCLNEFGETVGSYAYVDGTGNLQSVTDNDGNKIAYGYDIDNTPITMTANVNGDTNENIAHYTSAFLTQLKHNNFAIAYAYDGQGRTKAIKIAEQTYLTKEYNAHQETTGFANLGTFRQEYNWQGNPTNTYYQPTGAAEQLLVKNIYDLNGNLTASEDTVSQKTIAYDQFGDIKETKTQIHNTDFTITNQYDDRRNVTASTITVGEQTLNYQYTYTDNLDATWQQIALTLGDQAVMQQSIAYDQLGRTNLITTNHNLVKQINYLQIGDHTSDKIASMWYGVNNKIDNRLQYQYDAKGNITAVTENGQLLAKYAYDALSRIVREDNAALGKTYTYGYDNGGNILYRHEYTYSLKALNELTLVNSFDYVYPATGWRDQLLSYNGESFAYDAIGNPTTYRGKNLVWTGRQLDNYDGLTFLYNGDGVRVKKGNTKFYVNGTKIIAQDNGSKMLFHYGADGITGFSYCLSDDVVQNYFYRKNAQGDITGIYDNNNNLLCQYVYDAWGNHQIIVDENNTNAVFISNLNPFRYRGYYFDIETDLYYLNSRYYDPQTGRFINADNIGNIDTDNLNGLNLYAYCANNPITNIDTNGNAWWNPFSWDWKKIGEVVATVAIATVAVVAVVAVTVATAGVGTAIGAAMGGSVAATIAGGAIGGAVTGAITGAIVSGGISLISQGLTNGYDNINWGQVGIDTLIGMGTGALSGAIFGAIGSAVKVGNAAKAWDKGTFKSSFESMKYHYAKHGAKFGNIVQYTNSAKNFANSFKSNAIWKTYEQTLKQSGWLIKACGNKGLFNEAWKIIYFL